MILRMVPAVFALLLLAAHFFRAGDLMLALACALAPLLLTVRRRIALRAVQGMLAAAIPIWIHTAAVLTQVRLQIGAPWLRLMLILSAVALFTGASLWLLNTKTTKRFFPKRSKGQ